MSRAYRSDLSEDMMAYEDIIRSSNYASSTIKNMIQHLHRFDDYCVEQHHSTGILEKDIVTSFFDTYPYPSVIRKFGEYLHSIGKPSYVMPKRKFFEKPSNSLKPYLHMSANERL